MFKNRLFLNIGLQVIFTHLCYFVLLKWISVSEAEWVTPTQHLRG